MGAHEALPLEDLETLSCLALMLLTHEPAIPVVFVHPSFEGMTPDNPGPVHNTRARGVNSSEGSFMDISQCTSAPHREPDLALCGTHDALPLDNLYGVAPAHQTH